MNFPVESLWNSSRKWRCARHPLRIDFVIIEFNGTELSVRRWLPRDVIFMGSFRSISFGGGGRGRHYVHWVVLNKDVDIITTGDRDQFLILNCKKQFGGWRRDVSHVVFPLLRDGLIWWWLGRFWSASCRWLDCFGVLLEIWCSSSFVFLFVCLFLGLWFFFTNKKAFQ